jgi:4-diphosphocytidyl-2-C-methyl-D-erythritol kinase
MAADLARLCNDLEPAAVSLQPAIADALATLAEAPGCLLARMSGSGATCFGLFADVGAAERVVSLTGRTGWWNWAGSLRPG